TAAPDRGAHVLAFTTVSSTVSGTPFATPLAEPMLERMSLRTTPSWVRTFGPFEPSPGKGPSVSSGIFEQLDSASSVAVVVLVVEDAEDDVPFVVVVDPALRRVAWLVPVPPPHPATTAAAPRPPSSPSTCRRVLWPGSGSGSRSLMRASTASRRQ